MPRVKDPFNMARPSPYHCFTLTPKVRFINKNEIRNYILGLLHAVTCLMLGKETTSRLCRSIQCSGKRFREIDKLSLQFTSQTVTQSLCEKITNGFFVSAHICKVTKTIHACVSSKVETDGTACASRQLWSSHCSFPFNQEVTEIGTSTSRGMEIGMPHVPASNYEAALLNIHRRISCAETSLF